MTNQAVDFEKIKDAVVNYPGKVWLYKKKLIMGGNEISLRKLKRKQRKELMELVANVPRSKLVTNHDVNRAKQILVENEFDFNTHPDLGRFLLLHPDDLVKIIDLSASYRGAPNHIIHSILPDIERFILGNPGKWGQIVNGLERLSKAMSKSYRDWIFDCLSATDILLEQHPEKWNEVINGLFYLQTRIQKKRLENMGLYAQDGLKSMKVFFEKYPEMWIPVVKGILRLTLSAGSSVPGLFNSQLRNINRFLVDNPERWDGMLRMVESSGHFAPNFCENGLSAIGELITSHPENWDDIVKGIERLMKVIKSHKEFSTYAGGYKLFNKTLPALQLFFNSSPEQWDAFVAGIEKMAVALDFKSEFLFGEVLPMLAKFIINEPKNWNYVVKGIAKKGLINKIFSVLTSSNYHVLKVVPDILQSDPYALQNSAFWETIKDCSRHYELLNNPINILYWYELKKHNAENPNMSVLERLRLRTKQGFKDNFLERLFFKKYTVSLNLKDHPTAVLISMLNSGKISAFDVRHAQSAVHASKKQFPLDKTYYYQNTRGLTISRLTPVLIKETLLNLIIITLTSEKRWSQRHEQVLVQVNQIINNPGKLKDLINFSRSCIDQGNVFKAIQPDFNRLKQPEEIKAEELLVIIDRYMDAVRKNRVGFAKKDELFSQKIEPLMDIMAVIKSNLEQKEEKVRGVIIKTQKPLMTDIMSSDTTHCCAFYPYGNNKGAMGYLEDDYIGLLQYFTVDTKMRPDNIYGVIIFVICEDKMKNTILLIDSAEGDENMLKLMKNWQEIYHQTIIKLAKDIGAKCVVFGGNAVNTVPREFLKYISARLKLDKIYLKKKGDLIHERYLESFGGNTESQGKVTVYIEPI